VLGVAAGAADEGFTGLLRLTGISALGANLVNNLPAYLAMEPVVNGSALRMAALLVGVNIGPLITHGRVWRRCYGRVAVERRASRSNGGPSPSAD
jgi:hypothetical protein